jgi:peptide/nickel transport system permease protein
MIRYLLRRAGFYALAAWVALTLNFMVPRLMPGDPASVMFARFQGDLDPEAITALRETFGLTDAPMWQQYLSYLGHVAQGDFGTSVVYFPAPVSEVLMTGLMWTVFLAGIAVVLAFVIGPAHLVVHRCLSVFLAGHGCGLAVRLPARLVPGSPRVWPAH